MILHIPHSSDNLLGRDIPLKDRLLLTDWFTHELFDYKEANKIIGEVSRFVIDFERFPDDLEPMFEQGFGICYTKTLDGKDIVVKEKEKLLKIYETHHKLLNEATRKQIENSNSNSVYVVDCHSFESSLAGSDVDFCIGFNVHYKVVDTLKEFLENRGFTVGINEPYGGAIVPTEFNNNPKVKSVMIEVNKRLYCEIKDDKVVKNESFFEIKKLVSELLDIIKTEESRNDR